jgi:hypothetical protein
MAVAEGTETAVAAGVGSDGVAGAARITWVGANVASVAATDVAVGITTGGESASPPQETASATTLLIMTIPSRLITGIRSQVDT